MIATVAMSSGVAGSNFWLSVYLLWLGLEPRVAFWCSLLTMLFGFGSGVLRNWRAGTIDGRLVREHAPFMLSAAALGGLLAPRLPVAPLLLAYAVFVTFYGLWLGAVSRRAAEAIPTRPARLRATLAGALQGLIATGAGSLMTPAFLRRKPDRPAEAVGSAVLLVFLTSAVSATARVDGALWRALEANADSIASMMLFAASGAFVGGQLGPRLAARLPAIWLRRYVAIVLVVIGVLVARRAAGL